MKTNNILLVGPAGCGKTYKALQMAKGKKTLLLNMNANISYENLVEGIQLVAEDSSFRFDNKPQAIVQFIESIENDDENYLILDDINRVDITAVLGELCYAFSNRGKAITLKSGKRISIPENLILIATSCTSDIHSASNYHEELFNSIRYIDNNDDGYITALRGLKNPNCTLCDAEFEDYIEQFSKEYVRYKTNYCVFKKEYENDRREYEIGYGYFLPSGYLPVQLWGDCIQNKIRHQVRPLLEQYASDGIIKKEYIPDKQINDTAFILNKIKEENITVENVDYYKNQEDATFIYGNPLPQGIERQGGLQANPRYVTISFLLKEMITHSLINQMDLFDMLVNDEEILTFRNDIAAPNGRRGGRLLVADDERSLFTVIDSNNPNLSPYSDAFHAFYYKGRKYRLFSKYSSSDRCPFNVKNCVETSRGSQNRILYKTVKMLVYKYFKKYKSNLENYLINNDDPEIKSRLTQLNKDIEFVSSITTENRYINESFYVANNNVQDCIELIRKIRNLPTWQFMIKSEGAYRIMSTDYMQIMKATDVRQMILQGPPGTSKTYGAKRFLCEQANIVSDKWEDELKCYQLISSEEDENEYTVPKEGKLMYWDIVQFHPSYTYEDFVRGIAVFSKKESKITGVVDGKPIELIEKDTIGYKSVNRAIGKMAKLANYYYLKSVEEGDMDNCPNFFLIIDEINRANLATVFGELIFALEYRDKKINTPYAVDKDSQLVIPKNMFIVGTMNTADKSIGSIDYAIRRRFLFFKMLPDISVIKDSILKQDTNADFTKCDETLLFYTVNKLFKECLNSIDYDCEDVQLGHTYFLRTSEDESYKEQIKYKFLYQVIPILYEYKKDGVLDFERINIVDNPSERTLLEKLRNLILLGEIDREVAYNEMLAYLKTNEYLQNEIKDYLHDETNNQKDFFS